MQYREYLKSKDWKDKRNNKRAKVSRCGICASEDVLDVHHLNYKNLFDVELSDLRVLCHRCHFLAHDLHKQGKFTFRNKSHHSRWELLKNAVKKELGISGKNMFYPDKSIDKSPTSLLV